MERGDNDESKDTDDTDGDTGRVAAAASRQVPEWVE
jgi:hypothetical protein